MKQIAMEHGHWSPSEKKIAHAVFEAALEQELAHTLAEFKRRAAALNSADQMWALRSFLESSEREIQGKYDFRCSQLLFVFGRLVREGRVSAAQLQGLSQDKLDTIRRIVEL